MHFQDTVAVVCSYRLQISSRGHKFRSVLSSLLFRWPVFRFNCQPITDHLDLHFRWFEAGQLKEAGRLVQGIRANMARLLSSRFPPQANSGSRLAVGESSLFFSPRLSVQILAAGVGS
jgi:hypothetical protein